MTDECTTSTVNTKHSISKENFTLTRANRSINDPLKVVEDTMVEADKTFLTLEIQKNVHWKKKSNCSKRKRALILKSY
jgi:hypothetical protein